MIRALLPGMRDTRPYTKYTNPRTEQSNSSRWKQMKVRTSVRTTRLDEQRAKRRASLPIAHLSEHSWSLASYWSHVRNILTFEVFTPLKLFEIPGLKKYKLLSRVSVAMQVLQRNRRLFSVHSYSIFSAPVSCAFASS